MLGVKIDYKLNFHKYAKTLFSKANNKLRLRALAVATPYMSVDKKKILMNSFFNAQFNYCQLERMLHSRRNDNIIRNLHERCEYTMTKTHLMNIYLLKMAESLSITEIYRLWQPNCTQFKMDFRQNLLLKFLLLKQILIII